MILIIANIVALELGLRARLSENRVSGKSMVMMNRLRN
jgi:hypothetical protein